MKKLHRKLINHRKAANNLACKTFRNSEGKPYYTQQYIGGIDQWRGKPRGSARGQERGQR